MANQRRDGSILSSALTGVTHRRAVEVDFGMYRCMITKTYYIDDEGNFTFENQQVTYDAIILGGKKDGQIITNIKAAGVSGGQFNYYERIYRATEFLFSGPGRKPLKDHNGDIVYVQYINGVTALPVIIGAGVSPLDKDKTGAKKADGHILVDEYNGIRKSIDKDGNLKFQRFGGEWDSDKGRFKPADEAEITQSFTEQKITKTFKSGMEIIEDGEAELISFSLPSGTIITANGKDGVVTIDADGGTNQIVIDKGGEITIKASSKVKIDAPLVDVGENAAFSSTLFENLLSEFAKHTHNAPQAPSGTIPTTPPLVPLISLVGSQSVKVKD
tara:strand:+ start:30257 stop:31246 length:990 start_codon:yes stop_codon:yes gene_type:complete